MDAGVDSRRFELEALESRLLLSVAAGAPAQVPDSTFATAGTATVLTADHTAAASQNNPVDLFAGLQPELLTAGNSAKLRTPQANWSGDIPDGTVWATGTVQNVTGPIRVPAGAKLIIQPGAIIQFRAFSGIGLEVQGTVLAQGSAASPIVFTSVRDSTGLDGVAGTADDLPTGGGGTAANGDWSGLQFDAASTGNIFDHVQVRFAGEGNAGAIITAGALTLTNSVIANSGSAGVRIIGSRPILTGDIIHDSAQPALTMDLASNPTLAQLTLTKNRVNGVALDSGTLPDNATWDDPDVVYWLQGGGVTVPTGKTLTIAAGQIVKFSPYAGTSLVVNGTLNAVGTAAAPILFTSGPDDSVGGDTNNDGTASTPSADQWGRIEFDSTSTGSLLDHVEVRYAGEGSAALHVAGGQLTLTNSTVRNSSHEGVRIEKSNPVITGDTFQDNSTAALSMDLASNPRISQISFTHNRVNGLALDSGNLLADSFWDDPDVVYLLTGGGVTVPAGKTLTIAPGQIIKSNSYAGTGIVVSGTLLAKGTAAKPITFTSDQDDSIGGDTNNDGANSSGQSDQWSRIEFSSTSTGSVLDHVELRDAGEGGAAVRVLGGQLTFTNSLVRNSSREGIRIEKSSPVISGDLFQDNAGAAMSMDLASNPAITTISFTHNGRNGLVLDSGSLAADGFWDDPDVVYWLSSGGVTVPAGKTLTVAPGQVVKSNSYAGTSLLINGTLLARGTAAQPIIFTSSQDDSAGGDTNNDGTGSKAQADQWSRIEFTSSSVGSVIDHAEVRYAGEGVAGAIVISGGAVTLTNSLVRDSSNAGIRIQKSSPVLIGDSFHNNGGPALSMDLASNPSITGADLLNNRVNGLSLDSGSLVGNGFWDDPDVVYVLTGGGVTVPAGNTLNVAPGQIVKANAYAATTLIVNGTLLAKGTAGEPIIFTSSQDDSAGGDTNNDGIGSKPQSDQWSGVAFGATSTGSVLDHVEVRYAGEGVAAGIVVNGGQLSLTNSVVRDTNRGGLRIQSSNPTGGGNLFQNIQGPGISMDLKSHPVFGANRFSGNAVNGWQLDSGTLGANLSLDSTGDTVFLAGDISVPQGMLLTVGAGEALELQDFRNLTGAGTVSVAGTLRKSGTNDSSITPAVTVSGVVNVLGGNLVLRGAVTVVGSGFIIGQPGGVLTLSGGLAGNTQNATQFAPQNVAVNGPGSAAAPEVLEVMSRDAGLEPAGFKSNFDYYSLTLNSGAYVQLVDKARNSTGATPEALYVDTLTLASGSTLDLNGLHVYARIVQSSGKVVGGSINLLPNAGPLVLDNPTPGKISAAATVDDWTFFGRAGQSVTVAVGTGSAGLPQPAQPQLNFAQITLVDPSGATLGTASTTQSGADATLANTKLAVDGLYHVRIRAPPGHSSNTGNYVIGVWDATPRANSITLNQTVTGKIDTPYRVETWSFAAPAGQVVRLVLVNSEAAGIQFSLSGPNGFTAFSALSGSSDLVSLPNSGTYTLTVQGANHQTGAYAFRIEPAAPVDLTLGSAYAGVLAASDQAQVFRLQLNQLGALRVQLQDPSAEDHNELYLKLGAVPTRGDYQFASLQSASAKQEIDVPSAAPGTWYVLVYSAYVKKPGTFTLLAQQQALFLTGVTPDHAGNAADATLTLTGVGFDNSATVQLVSASNTIINASSLAVDLPTQMTAVFKAGAVPAGVYSVKVTQANGSATLSDAFTSIQGGQAQLEVNLDVPGSMGYHIPGVIYLEYRNTGTVAMPAPLLLFQPTQTHANGTTDAKAFLTLDPTLVTAGFWTSARPAGFSSSVEILASGATPGVLQPGESERVPIYYAGWQQPWDLSYPDFQYQVITLRAEDSVPLDWSSLKNSLQPTGVDSAAWNVIFTNLMSITGNTVGDYVRSLDQNAAYLGQLGEKVTDVGQLLGFEVAQAEGLNLVSELGSTVDAGAIAPGMSLAFSRAFDPSISGRSRLGPLGLGWAWTGPWDTHLSAAADGTVTIAGPDGHNRVFQPDSRGGYLALGSDQATLTATGGGTYSLKELTGEILAYNASGRINYVEDTNHNRITAGYTGSLLTSLTHSSGQTLKLAYNAAGRIISVTDPVGRATTYTYDASNQHLLSVTGFDGRSLTYTYSTAGDPAQLNTLLSTTTPDGVHQFFGYDSHGRLSDAHQDGNASDVTLAYGPAGQVSATDAVGATTTYFFDYRGLVIKADDALHRDTIFTYDAGLHLIAAIDAVGQVYSYAYDAKGNLIQSTDPLGQTRQFSYGGPFDELVAMTDAKGNATRYSYDDSGNLLAITYADGTQDSAVYSPIGNVTSATDQRGQTVTYSYDSSGRLLSKTFPDGSHTTYVYDARGNLTTVSDSTGTTNLTYDAQDRLVKVTYPGDRFISYTYDPSGRRTSLADQTGFTIHYAYDSLGRLAALTDAAGKSLASYAYDKLGNIQSRQDADGSSTSYSYDAAGELTQVVNTDGNHQVVSQFDYTYDLLGRRTTMTTLEGVWTYSYDALGQLTHAVFKSNNTGTVSNQDLTYAYDAAGNRISAVENGVSTSYTTNVLNQYISAGSAAYSYDADGNLIQKAEAGVTTTLTYDIENHLTASSAPGDSWSYQYNSAGAMVTATHNGDAVSYVTDPTGFGNVLGVYASGGALAAHLIQGGELIGAVAAGGQTTFFQFDGTGNTVGVVGSAGSVTSSISYLPFGGILKATNAAATPFQFAGAFGVMQTGAGLTWMRARSYDPELGRFVQSDPLGTAADVNVYRYVNNNPVSQVDPSGLLDPATIATISGLFQAAARLGLSAQAEAIFRGSLQAVAQAEAEYVGAVEVNVPQLLSGLRNLLSSAGRAAVRAGGAAVEGAVEAGATVAAPGVTVAAPAVTVAAPAVTVAAPAATVAAPAAAGAGAATEVAVGSEAVEVAAVAEGVGGWGIAAGTGLVAGSGIAGAVVGTVINDAVLSEDTKEIIGDTLLGSWESIKRLFGSTENSFANSHNVASHDPNDKLGPSGFGSSNFLPPDQPFSYRVDFENDKSATAPAQRVTVSDQLDSNLDWNSFELREVGFGDTLITILPGQQHFQTTLSLTQNGHTFELQIEVGIHADYGQVYATFQSVDPATSLPPDVLTGFLPPEDGTGRGMGHFSYVIKPKSGFANGTQIRNVALVTFDANPSISTDQKDPHDPTQGTDPAKQDLVTIDARAPTVVSASVNGQSSQRSTVRSISFTFDEDTAVQAQTGALQLFNNSTGQPVSTAGVTFSYNPATKTGTFDVSGLALPDGNYTATLVASKVTDLGGLALGADFKTSFFVLAGDANGDRVVNELDLYGVWAERLKPAANRSANDDLNGDGQIDDADLAIVRAHYLAKLPAISGALTRRLAPTPSAAAPAARQTLEANQTFLLMRMADAGGALPTALWPIETFATPLETDVSDPIAGRLRRI